MRHASRVLALVITIAAVASWLALGANRGWTKTTVPVKTVDEITGIEALQYERRFTPGIELLAGALVAAGLLAGGSLLFRSKTNNNQT